jgi:hypothetical protein
MHSGKLVKCEHRSLINGKAVHRSRLDNLLLEHIVVLLSRPPFSPPTEPAPVPKRACPNNRPHTRQFRPNHPPTPFPKKD